MERASAARKIMNDLQDDTFRGLPLTPDQMREIAHYIHTRQRAGADWDTPELRAMLGDMLNPPEQDHDEQSTLLDSTAAERTVADNEESDQLDLLRCERDRQH
jgi:hypothetical protein